MKKFSAFVLALSASVFAARASFALGTGTGAVAVSIDGRKLPVLEHVHSGACAPYDANAARIVCILDRSGSMQALTTDTIGGYNSFIGKQREEAPGARVTTVLFDDRYETICDGRAIADVEPLTQKEYYARGSTALLDAVGSTILRVDGGFKQARKCPRSELVVFMIITDGLENASREFSRPAVRKLVSDAQEKYGWKFVFMGANIDSAAEAGSLGIEREAAMDFKATSSGVGAAYESAGAAVKALRSGGSLGGDWKKAAPEK